MSRKQEQFVFLHNWRHTHMATPKKFKNDQGIDACMMELGLESRLSPLILVWTTHGNESTPPSC
jgi:hypothetical protein